MSLGQVLQYWQIQHDSMTQLEIAVFLILFLKHWLVNIMERYDYVSTWAIKVNAINKDE